jgi:N-acylglucosamine 2-epimerase
VDILESYAQRYRTELFDRVIPFWLEYSLDRDFGGFFSCLDKEGSVYDTRKYVWLQGRSVWMFSRLYNQVEKKDEWLAAARSGAEFLQRHVFDPGGRCYFSLTREGMPASFQRKPYAAVFTALGFLEYAQASRERSFQDEAAELFWRIQSWIEFPGMLGRPVLEGSPPTSQLADAMVMIMLGLEFSRVIPDGRYHRVMQDSIDTALRHADPEKRYILENVAPNGGRRFDLPEGRLSCPGHSAEVAWLILHALERSPDEVRQEQVLDLLEGALELGWDKEYGGLLYFVDVRNRPMPLLEADMKLWWPHTEAIYAVLLAYCLTEDKKWLVWLERLDAYAFEHFSEQEFGSWYGYCDRRGNLTSTCKGNNYMSVYHTARFLLMSIQAIEKHTRRQSAGA